MTILFAATGCNPAEYWIRRMLLLFVLLGLQVLPLQAASFVMFEAESGVSGSEITNGVSGDVHFISASTDLINTGNPGSAERVVTYAIAFPVAGTYQLYARVRVGPAGANDDSLFYANSFGLKSPTTSGDWVTVNGIGGFTNSTDVVTGGGSLGSGIWKWINLSQRTSQAGFSVSSDSLMQMFQIGAREDGLAIDKFVFGMQGVIYTVADLDAGLDGSFPDGDATVNWTDIRQQIDGFGGGVVFLNDGSSLTEANADILFRTNTLNQLGLTLLRVRVEPNNNWMASVSAWNGSVQEARRAALRGAGVLATPWTPPAAMKTSGSTIGGSLLPEQYANYAAYLEKYASNMLANGVALSAISLQNEPDWDPDYEGCVWTGIQFRNFFHTNAGVIKSAPVMMPESLGFNANLSDPSLNDPVAVTNIGLIGGHLYGMPVVQPYNNAFNKGKRVWQTEYLINDQSMETSIQTAKQIHDCLTTGRMSAYIWWKCLGNINGLVSASGVIQRRGFVMSQFSRFVRPGFVRIGESNTGSGSVSAYKNTNNSQFAIVAINSHGLAFEQTIRLANFPALVRLTPWITSATQSLAPLPALDVTNGVFTYSLPPNSIITFAGEFSGPVQPLPALAHRYSFSDAGGTTVADSAAGPAWNGTLPNGGILSGGQLTLNSNSQQHVRVPAGIVSTFDDFTVAAWVRLTTTANWTRIFDFGNNTTTYMFLTPQNGANARVRFAMTTNSAAGEQQITGNAPLGAGVWHHVVVTLRSNVGVLYVDGVAVGTNNSMTLRPSSLGITLNNYIGRSQWPDPYFNGAIDEFRIYRAALSPAEIAAMHALGPDELLSGENPVISVESSVEHVILNWPLASAGFQLQSSTNLSLGAWQNVTQPAPGIVGDRWLFTNTPDNREMIFYRLIK